MTSTTVHHQVFARFFDRLSYVVERDAGPRRAELLAALSGRIVEVGGGNGCHCARDTLGAIRSAGFSIVSVRKFNLGPAWVATNPHVLGVARAPARMDAAT